MATHVGYLRLNHLSPWGGSAGWPDWELPFVRWAEREGYALDVATNADLEDHPGCSAPSVGATGCPVRRATTSTGRPRCATRSRASSAGGGNAAFLSGNTSFWQVRLEDRVARRPGADDGRLQGPFKHDPVFGTDRAGGAHDHVVRPSRSAAPRTT